MQLLVNLLGYVAAFLAGIVLTVLIVVLAGLVNPAFAMIAAAACAAGACYLLIRPPKRFPVAARVAAVAILLAVLPALTIGMVEISGPA